MVKRDKSPEVVEDSRFFTIFLPYPLNGNWQDEAETKKLAWWIAECVGEDNLWAILWKPSSAGMVLIEVSKSFTDHGRLLGEHRWVEVLKNPTDEEKQGSSRIFHCFYNAYREAQKDGWKIAAVTKDWFEDWKPGNGNFKQPYPDTYWCAVPVEDRTGKPLCRPLPLEAKSPPPQVQLPVVGSSKWVEKQAEAAPKGTSWPKKQHQPRNPSGGWGKNPYAAASSPVSEISPWGPPAGVSPSASGASSPVPATPMSGDDQLPAESAPNKTLNKPAWGKPVPLKNFNNEGNNQNKGTSGWSKPVRPPAPAGGISPLAEPKPTGPVNAWNKPLKVTLAQQIGARAEPTVATMEADVTINTTNRGKLNPLAQAAAAAAASVGGKPETSAGGSGLPARPAIRSEPIRTRKEANEELARNASKRKEREENERRSGHVVGTSLGGDREGPWSVNPSPPQRARTDPPEGYENAVNEREKVRGKEREKDLEHMEVDPPVGVCVKQGEDVKMEEDEEKLRNKLIADPVDVKMETTEAVDSAAKNSGHNRYSPSGGRGVADSMWSSHRDEDIDSSGSRRRDRAPRSKPLDWGRSSTNRDGNRSESGRRRDDSHWSPPPRSERDDRSHRPDVRDRDSKYSSGSRRDDRDKDLRYRDSERSYRPRDDKYSSRTDRTRERGGADSSRSKREERSPDRDRRRDRERDRDRDSRDDRGSPRTKEDTSPGAERKERERDTRWVQKDDDREKEIGLRDSKDWDASSTRQAKDEARAGGDEEMTDEVPTTNAACPGEPKETMRESEETCVRVADMDVYPSTTRSVGDSWFVQSTHLDWGSLPTDEPKPSSDTKKAEEGHRQSSRRSEEEKSRAGRGGWGRDNSRSTRGGDDYQSSRRRDDDLKSRSRRERGSGTRSERDRGGEKRSDRDWENLDRSTWDGKEREKDIRSRHDREKERTKRDKSGTWEMKETEQGVWDGEFDDRDRDRRSTKHKSVLSIDGESEGGGQPRSQREASPFLSELADNLGMTALSPPAMEAQGDIRKGEEASTSWGPDTKGATPGWPDPGDQANTAGSSGWPMPGDNENTTSSGLAATDPDYGKWTVSKKPGDDDNTAGSSGWPTPGDNEYTTSSGKWGLAATDSDYGKWTVSKPKAESDASQGYVPTYSGYPSRKNDKDRKPDWSERSRDSGRGRPSRGRPRDDWVPPKTRDSGWSSRKKENDKWKSDSSQVQWTGPVETLDPAGDWAGLFTATDSQPQWTGPVECVDPAGDWAGVFTSTDSQPKETVGSVDPEGDGAEFKTVTDLQPQWTGPVECHDPAGDWAGVFTATDAQQAQWTGSIVDPAGDWASAELQIQEDGEPEPYEYIPWVPGVRGGGRGRYGRGRVRGPRVRKKKVRTIGLMRGFQDDPKEEEDEDEKPEGASEAEPNPFWYLAEGETPEDEAAKWGVPSS